MPLLRSACLASFLLGGCAMAGGEAIDDRCAEVRGGEPSNLGAVAALYDGDRYHCSGTLIRPSVVVTAAHCLDPEATRHLSYVEVALSDLEVEVRGQRVGVIGGGIHPDYEFRPINEYPSAPNYGEIAIGKSIYGYLMHDIAVLELAAPLKGHAPMVTEPLRTGEPLVIAAYGPTEDYANDSDVLRQAEVRSFALGDNAFLTEPREGAEAASCRGDSGGSLFREGGGGVRFAGIISQGNCRDLTVATDVTAYADFLGPYLDAEGKEDGLCP